MIPRYQRIAFYLLAGGSLLMLALLIRGCVRNEQHVIAMRDQSPIAAPVDAPDQTVTVANANDAEGTLTLDQLTLPLPDEPGTRARVLLERVFADYAGPSSAHPLPAGPAIANVFFVPLPLTNPGQANDPNAHPTSETSGPSPYGANHVPGAVLAVVDFTRQFADRHPSSIEAEDLTVRSIIGTLHANFPEVEEVRFLVGGQGRETLAGHASLDRPYPSTDGTKQVHPLSAEGSFE